MCSLCCLCIFFFFFFFFFFNDTATTEIYTLSLHDALPICPDFLTVADIKRRCRRHPVVALMLCCWQLRMRDPILTMRSEEHTSELQSRLHLVCRLLLEKKKKI